MTRHHLNQSTLSKLYSGNSWDDIALKAIGEILEINTMHHLKRRVKANHPCLTQSAVLEYLKERYNISGELTEVKLKAEVVAPVKLHGNSRMLAVR